MIRYIPICVLYLQVVAAHCRTAFKLNRIRFLYGSCQSNVCASGELHPNARTTHKQHKDKEFRREFMLATFEHALLIEFLVLAGTDGIDQYVMRDMMKKKHSTYEKHECKAKE